MQYDKYFGYDGSNGQLLIIGKVIIARCRDVRADDYKHITSWDITDDIPMVIQLCLEICKK